MQPGWPREIPGGGWIVMAEDPQGAHFALVGPRTA
jgi:predicted enzyme related to lactoylglutathione lyase